MAPSPGKISPGEDLEGSETDLRERRDIVIAPALSPASSAAPSAARTPLRRRPLIRLAAAGLALALGACNGWWHQELSDYPVFFEPKSAKLDETAKAVIKVAADYAKEHPRLNVVVNGYVDQTDKSAESLALAESRAKAVTDELVADGVARERIHYNAHGPADALLSGQADRRVDITIGG
jgi:outer membrane protein OmpA-like peptidoglycan-associated protein